MTTVVSVPPFYVTREECAKILGYASSGLRKFIAEHPDFPIGVRRDPNAKNAPERKQRATSLAFREKSSFRVFFAPKAAGVNRSTVKPRR